LDFDFGISKPVVKSSSPALKTQNFLNLCESHLDQEMGDAGKGWLDSEIQQTV
jgi:hypothetical protein